MKKVSKADPLRNALLMKIQSGLIMPGEFIPSEKQLCMIYHLTRPTVRKVLAELCGMGLLEKQPGVGAVVKAPHKNGCDMEKIIRIGSNSLFGGSEYYAQPLSYGVQHSPYGKHCFFSPLMIEDFNADDYSHLDALLLSRIPVEIKPQIVAFKKPVLFLNNYMTAPNIGNIYIDNYCESKRAVDCLIKYGHRRIAVVGGNGPTENLRLRGYEDALAENGLPLLPELLLTGEGFDTIEKMENFLRKNKFTAIYFSNGSAFLKTFQFFRARLGGNFNNCSLLIFDDISKMNVFDGVHASFIRQPLKEMGDLAAEYLRKKVCNPEHPVIDKCLKCTLLIK